MISFAEFAPDKSPFDPNACDRLENVLPRSNSFGPFPAFVPLTDALPDRPQGAFLAEVGPGQYLVFVGTSNALYVLDPANLDWDDVSRPSGPYNTSDSVRWSFTQFGDLVLAANGVDEVQSIDVSVALTNFDDLSADAPVARFAGVLGDFVFLSHLNTGRKWVQWSGLNQPEFWTPKRRSSDFQPFPDGGDIMGFSGFERGGVIFHEHCIREGSLNLQSSLVVTFRKTVENHGVAAPKSIVTTGQGIFYLALDGFYKYGSPPVPIGNERVDDFFKNDVSDAELYDVYGTADPQRKIVYWAYRSLDNTTERSYDKFLAYHYSIDRWSMVQPGTFLTGLIEATTPGYTLDSLNDLGLGIDDLPYSLDSRAWTSGSPALAAFDLDFKLGFFAGDPLRAILQTGDASLTSGRRTFVSGFRPLGDAPQMQGRVMPKDRAGQQGQFRPVASANRTGLVPCRADGRFHRFEVRIPKGVVWSHVHGVEPDGRPSGQQ